MEPGQEAEAVAEIVDGVARANGDLTWQAQIHVPRPGLTHRTFLIRGPSRPDKQDAESDLEKLEKAYKSGGVKDVRKVQSTLNVDARRQGGPSS